MNIRFVFRQNGRLIESIYSLQDLENGALPNNLKALKQDLNLVRRDLGTGLTDKSGYIEIFENDVIATTTLRGRVEYKDGMFSVDGVPLGKLNQDSITIVQTAEVN